MSNIKIYNIYTCKLVVKYQNIHVANNMSKVIRETNSKDTILAIKQEKRKNITSVNFTDSSNTKTEYNIES